MGRHKANTEVSEELPLITKDQEDETVNTEVSEELKDQKKVVIIANNGLYMKKGSEYTVTGETAYNLIKKGFAKLK